MKLPDAIDQFLHKPPREEEAYLSLVLQAQSVQAAVWTMPAGKKPHLGEAASERVEADAWDKRLEACDRAIAKIAQKAGRDDFENVVLGLAAYYLTHSDDIRDDLRGSIKTLTSELELTPIGFVPIHQAIVHQMKEEEGVPPSVILLEIGPSDTAVIIYKVGAVVGRDAIALDELVAGLERVLKGLKELEVLPSRMILYGPDEGKLEEYKRDLLKHPWPTRANFLHYPKIEILPTISLAGAVSLAGASELASHIGSPPVTVASEPEEKAAEEEAVIDQNVVEVSPETLGFRRDVDILEKPVVEEEKEPEEPALKQDIKETLSRFISSVKLPQPPKVSVPKAGIVVLLLFLLLIAGAGWLSYWVLPKASITILQLPQVLSESSSVTVNPTATVVDAASKTVPGRKQEKTVNGEKTIAVTGQKDIGDPARGTVTVYNKTTVVKQLKKGAVLVAGSLSFTLDSDVSIASASESVGSITFGKGSAAITAAKLGTQSNLPAGTEFILRDTPASVMVARNEAPLSGGTSKVVTVVSRADQEKLVDGLTAELIDKAKKELETSVAGAERLIDETVKTTVTSKKFDAELDQESKELRGSITVTIAGISYNVDDISLLFTDLVKAKVPASYTLREGGARVEESNVKVQKDGTITMMTLYEGQALPTFDPDFIRTKLAGKPFTQVQAELGGLAGVAGIEIGKSTGALWGKNTFPANAKNITVSVAVLE